MAVGFFCNMNNHPFASVRYLRDEGVDAHLVLLNNESPHFHPSADTFSLDFQRYTHRVEWGDPYKITATAPADVRSEFVKYQFIVGCNTVPAYFHRAGVELDLFSAHGSDIAEFPFYRPASPRRGAVSSVWMFPYHQRRGIAETRIVAGPKVPVLEPLYGKLGFVGERWYGTFPPLYAKEFNPNSIEQFAGQANYYTHFKKIREAHDIVIFHHARHIWAGRSAYLSEKGNDKLIRGFARMLRAHPDVKAALILFEYGTDVSSSQKLIARMGIADQCFWFPLMARKELMLGASLADIVCGEFGPSWNFGGTILEGIAMAKPLLHYRDDSLYPTEELFPIMNANTDDDIFRALSRYVASPEEHRQLGRRAYDWFDENIIRRPVRDLLALLARSGSGA